MAFPYLLQRRGSIYQSFNQKYAPKCISKEMGNCRLCWLWNDETATIHSSIGVGKEKIYRHFLQVTVIFKDAFIFIQHCMLYLVYFYQIGFYVIKWGSTLQTQWVQSANMLVWIICESDCEQPKVKFSPTLVMSIIILETYVHTTSSIPHHLRKIHTKMICSFLDDP